MVSEKSAREFLALRRLAVVGASADPKKFGNTIYKELKAHGYDAVAVNPSAQPVEGDPCYPDVASVSPPVDGAIVMVGAASAITAVRECIDAGVRRIWLFKGAGPGAVSPEAVALCERNGVEVIAGACPLMWLEPVAWIHRAHRTLRHLSGTLKKKEPAAA